MGGPRARDLSLLCRVGSNRTVDSPGTLREQSSLRSSGLSIVRMIWDELEAELNRIKRNGKGDVLDRDEYSRNVPLRVSMFLNVSKVEGR